MMKSAAALWESLRPGQWTKNLFLFAGLLFSRNLFQPDLLARALAGFGIFCLLSGAIYLWNDLADRPQDRRHPAKAGRPLASGRLKVSHAVAALLVLLAVSLIGAVSLGRAFFLTACLYFLLQVLYIFFLKRAVILDVFAVTGGFVLRVAAGTAAVAVEISSWLLICTIFLALFISLGKRRQELAAAGGKATERRQVLGEYTLPLLDQMISVATACTVLAYTLYTQSEETVVRFGTRGLIWTVLFVLYGVFRYLYLIHCEGIGEEPETVLLTDKPLMAAAAGWILTVFWMIYG